jgi:hypothetical protein
MTGFRVVIPAGAQHPHCHPGRSEAESRDPWMPGRPQRSWLRQAPYGSRIKSGMTGFRVVPERSPLTVGSRIKSGMTGSRSLLTVIPAAAKRRAGIHGCPVASEVRGFGWIPDQVRDDGIPGCHPGPKPPHCHPGRSEAESRDPWMPGRPQRSWLRQAPYGSRIKSGMTGFRVVIPAGAQPPHCHPGRSEAESRDPWVPGRPPKFVASPSPLWIPDQVRDDGIPGCHPGRSAAPSLSSRPERSGEPGSMECPAGHPNVRGFAKPLWIPDQVRDDGILGCHPGRSGAPSPSSRPQRSGEPGSTGVRAAISVRGFAERRMGPGSSPG